MEVHSTVLEQNLQDDIYAIYPFLAEMDPQSSFVLMNNALPVSLPPQTFLQTEKGPYEHFFLLLEGNTRVYQCDENGRELTFYRNFPGDICSMNLHQVFHQQPAQALVRAETAIHGLQISANIFKQTIKTSDIFRDQVFAQLTSGFDQLAKQMQRAVFEKLDSRLCKLLQEMFKRSQQLNIKITHQKLANELGTTREVISRSLKALENKGCLKINRGQLIMVDPSKLK